MRTKTSPIELERWLEVPEEGSRFEFKEKRNKADYEEIARYATALANEGGEAHRLLATELVDTVDRVLVAAAECFLAALRPYDTVYRYGGEEFLFCLPDAPADIAQKILERVLGELRSKSITVHEGRTVSVTCSFGIAQVDADATVDETVKRADRALYQAKNEGRDRVCIWDGADEAATPEAPRPHHVGKG